MSFQPNKRRSSRKLRSQAAEADSSRRTPRGLTLKQVEISRLRYGDNVLVPPPSTPLWKQFLEKFNDPLIKILLIAVVLSTALALYELASGAGTSVLIEPMGIVVAVLLATLIGFLVEVNANKRFSALNKKHDDEPVKVVRSGRITTTPRRDIVVGDIVLLETGDRVPADGTIVQSVGLLVDESSLTGEPSANKSNAPQTNVQTTYPANMLLRGSTLLDGHGVMRVDAVGMATEYGKVFTEAQIDTDTRTPLMAQFDDLGRLIARWSYFAAALIIVGRTLMFMLDDTPAGSDNIVDSIQYFVQTIMLAVTLIVVSVPEGLPMSVTISLALSMHRMLASGNLVRRMHACETMGAASIICTDKTGTLTRNAMSVFACHFNNPDDPHTTLLTNISIAVNATAHLDLTDPLQIKPLGNATEAAMLHWLYDNGIDYLQLRGDCVVRWQVAFSTRRKLMATAVDHKTLGPILLVKGAPEVIMQLCRQQARHDSQHYQQRGMRTLAFAVLPLTDSQQEQLLRTTLERFTIGDNTDRLPALQYLGFIALNDPVRDDVKDAISDCRNAGIEVKMVTGDTPATAREVARHVGIITDEGDDSTIITGVDFAAMDDNKARQAARHLKVLARARPDDKARLVNLLQTDGEVVAVTGDGTNDAPALNAAMVGLAMGDGTSVAKEAGDITIMNNSFTGICSAVLWGRSLYRNIQRFILFQLTVNVCACLVVCICSFFTDRPPLTVTQMLWVNLIMDSFAALALASLPPNSIVMRVPPRRYGENIITRDMARLIFGIGISLAVAMIALFYFFIHHGNHSRALFTLHPNVDMREYTIFFTSFILLHFWNLFNARAWHTGHSAFHNIRHSGLFFATLAVIAVGQVLIVQCFGSAFQVVPLSLRDWLMLFAATSPIMLLGEIFRALIRSKSSKTAK